MRFRLQPEKWPKNEHEDHLKCWLKTRNWPVFGDIETSQKVKLYCWCRWPILMDPPFDSDAVNMNLMATTR